MFVFRFPVSVPLVPSHWFRPIGSVPLVPSHWFRPIGSVPLVPSHWFRPIGSVPLVPSHWFRPIGSVPLVPSHWFRPIGSVPLVPSHWFRPIGSVPLVPSHWFRPWRAWRRPTLPRLKTQYHRRGGFSRPSSGWDRVVRPSLWPPDRRWTVSGNGEQGSGNRDQIPFPECDCGCCWRTWYRVSSVLFVSFMQGVLPLHAMAEAGSLFSDFCFLSSDKKIKPIERLVPVSFTHCCASTPGLSTWWSTTALRRDLVSRGVSHLDAFSGYPVRP